MDIKPFQLPFSFNMTENLTFTIHEMTMYNQFDEDDDVEVGHMLISDNISNKTDEYTIWFGDEDFYYVCFPLYEMENDNDELEVLSLDTIFE